MTKSKNKKRVIILVIILIIVLVGSGASAYFYNQYRINKNYENKVCSDWNEINIKSNSLDNDLQNIKDEKSYQGLKNKVADLETIVKSKSADINSANVTKTYQGSKINCVAALDAYVAYLDKISDNIANKKLSDINVSQTFVTVQASADDAKSSINNIKNDIKFCNITINNGVFDLSKLKQFISSWQKQQKIDQATIAEKQTVENVVMNSINCINSHPNSGENWDQNIWNDCSQYWAPVALGNGLSDYNAAFVKTYLGGIGGLGVYSFAGGKITNVTKISDNEYQVNANEKLKCTKINPDDFSKNVSYYSDCPTIFTVGKQGENWLITNHSDMNWGSCCNF